MSISRRTSWSLLVGLGGGFVAAGCAAKGDAPADAARDAPALAAPAAGPHVDAAPSAEADAQRARVVNESVSDNVDRVTRIIAQREQAKQDAADVRERREARRTAEAAIDPTAADSSAATASASDDVPAIERLAAALRAREPIDADPPANPPAPAPPAEANEALAGASASAAGDASGALEVPTRLQVTRAAPVVGKRDQPPIEAGPDVARPSAVNPFVALRQQYVDRVADDPRDLVAQLDLQLLRLLKGEPVPAMGDLTALPAEDRELLAALCDALSNFRSLARAESNPLASAKARPFMDMAERIGARADLTLSALTLCERVAAFGKYEQMPLDRLLAGEPRWCVLYCEVDGFLSQLDAQQLWETKLSLELKLYDARGLQVWTLPAEVFSDASRRRRRDFFIAKRIQLPASLQGGNYLLKATVKDVQANRIDESSIQFTVAGKDPVPQ